MLLCYALYKLHTYCNLVRWLVNSVSFNISVVSLGLNDVRVYWNGAFSFWYKAICRLPCNRKTVRWLCYVLKKEQAWKSIDSDKEHFVTILMLSTNYLHILQKRFEK